MRAGHAVPGAALLIAAALACSADRERGEATGETQRPSSIRQEGVGYYQDVSWAPDGSSLVVSVLEESSAPEGFQYRVHRLDLDPLELVALTPGPMDLWTSWDRREGRVAYGSRSGDASDIFVVRPDGSERTRLTTDPGNDTQPAWSPDGRRIAFVSDREGSEQLFVMNADGSGQARVGVAERSAQTPSWSPDGSRIAYFETDSTGDDEIYVMDADGSGRRLLVAGTWPKWTVEGDRILYAGADGLRAVGLDGARDTLLIAAGEFGVFSPDGERIAYIATREGRVEIHVAAADGSSDETLLSRPAPEW